MKRIVSLLLCMMMAFSIMSATAETGVEQISFEPNITVKMDKDAKEWVQGEEIRAIFTVAILMDYLISLDGEDPAFDLNILSNTSYVGRSGFMVVCLLLAEDNKKALVLVYHTLSHDAAYSVMEFSGKSAAEKGLEAVCEDGYYKNDVTDIYKVYTRITEAMNN